MTGFLHFRAKFGAEATPCTVDDVGGFWSALWERQAGWDGPFQFMPLRLASSTNRAE